MRYQDVAKNVQFELLFDDMQLVLLKPEQKVGPEANLIGFRSNGELLWRLPPPLTSIWAWDAFVHVWIRAGEVWVSSWSGFSLRIDHRTGDVLEQVFTK